MTKSRGIRVRRGTRLAWLEANQGRHLCQCGCEQPIELRPEHFSGVPKYRHGHNPQPTKPKPPRQPCACGCGQLATSGKQFVNGHNGRGIPRPQYVRDALSQAMSGERSHRYGKKPHNFVGRHAHGDGYVYAYAPGHPFGGTGKRVFEHRLVLEQYLRETDPASEHLTEIDGVLYLRPEVEVHHVDGDKTHNVVENLRPLSKAEHAREHVGRLVPPYRGKTHCKHGHEFTPENTYQRPNGSRGCQTCIRERNRLHSEKRKAARRSRR